MSQPDKSCSQIIGLFILPALRGYREFLAVSLDSFCPGDWRGRQGDFSVPLRGFAGASLSEGNKSASLSNSYPDNLFFPASIFEWSSLQVWRIHFTGATH